MRALGIDVGRRRVGVAISDRTCTLARPLTTLPVSGMADAAMQVAALIGELTGEDDGLDRVVVGMPLHLDGSPTDATPSVIEFVDRLRRVAAIPIVTEDERLTSHEAEHRLAVNEPDWRKRKSKLDAAAAAVILQDYLDR